jgi:hypothetical protein
MMEQAVDDKRGWRAMECGGGGVGDGGNDKGGDCGSMGKDGGNGCSKCNGNGSGDSYGRGDGNGRDDGSVEGNGIGNAAMAVAATTKAATMMQSQPHW